MTNETTYLENLLNNRKVVRNYKKTSLEDTKLKNISKFSIKIPTAGFSRGIEILNTFDVKKIKNVFLQHGTVAEWLGRALQKLVQRFESARCLSEKPVYMVGFFYRISAMVPPITFLRINLVGFPWIRTVPPTLTVASNNSVACI